jgi:hypothetical protein
MASVLNPNTDDENQQAQGTVNTTTSAGGGGAGPTAGTTGTTGTPVAQAPAGVSPQTATQNDVAKITAANQNIDWSPLVNYVAAEGTNAGNAINTANTNFNNTLGTFSGFDQNAQNQLASVLKGSTPLSTGQSMLTNSYTPTPINNASYDPLTQQYFTDATSLTNSSGIQNLLGTMHPEMTPGQRAYDATIYGGNAGYNAAANAQLANAQNLLNYGNSITTNSRNATAQRANDVNAFNTAAQGYVTSQRDAVNNAIQGQIFDANNYDKSIQQEMLALQQGRDTWANAPTADFAFDRNLYAPRQFVSQYGPDVFNQTVDPALYLKYLAGQNPTRENVTSQDQATQFNNAEALLNGFDHVTPGVPRMAASLGIDANAWQAALAQMQANEDAADAAWIAAHTPQPAQIVQAPPPPPQDLSWGSGGGEGPSGGDASSGDSGADAASGGDYFKGGVVRRNPGPRMSNPLNKLQGTRPANQPLGPAATPSPLANNPALQAALEKQMAGSAPTLGPAVATPAVPATLPSTPTLGYTKGGYIPVGTGNPGIRDDIPARVDDGEFVVRRPSVNAVGENNLVALNKMNAMPPAKQQLVRSALQAALARAR